ncbi:MAG TPA: agmatine deiminase family protein [Thermoanaerobaculia bacterium]|nr:agmatine deiminase family protein [Thermoanaerobaculia bacterium]
MAASSAQTGPTRMPAEWEPHEATWLAWPHNAADWPGRFAPIHWVYAEILRKLAPRERVRLIVRDRPHELRIRRTLEKVGVDLARVDLFRWATDRSWTRDTGPVFVLDRARRRCVAHFRFDGWAKYRNSTRDARIPARAAKALGVSLIEVQRGKRQVVLEGGAIDVNGQGSILTTEECLLDPEVQVRNPGFDRAHYEQLFASVLGAANTIWLGRGIAGDDTHGHVDDLARFVSPRTIVLCRESDAADPNHRVLGENRERLEAARLEDGARPEIVDLPMPRPLFFDGQRLPASYANFYVANGIVLVPTFNDPADRVALGILAELFPDREVVGIHSVELVWGLGTLHCLSQQEPATAEMPASAASPS